MTYMWMVYTGCAIFLVTLFSTFFLINKFSGKAHKDFMAWMVSGFSFSLILLFLSKINVATAIFAVLTLAFWIGFIVVQRKIMREQAEVDRVRKEREAIYAEEDAKVEAEKARKEAEREARLEKQIAEYRAKHEANN